MSEPNSKYPPKKDTIFSIALRQTLERFPHISAMAIVVEARSQGARFTPTRLGQFKNGTTVFTATNLQNLLVGIKGLDVEAFNFYIARLVELAATLPPQTGEIDPSSETRKIELIYRLHDVVDKRGIEQTSTDIGITPLRLSKILHGEGMSPDEETKISNLLQTLIKMLT